MPQFNTLNVPQVMNQAETFKARRFANERNNVYAQREDEQYDDDMKLQNTRFLKGSTDVLIDLHRQGKMDEYMVAANELAPVWMERKILDIPGYDPNVPPDIEAIKGWNASSTAALAGMTGGQPQQGNDKTAKIQQAEWWLGANEEEREGYLASNYAGKVATIDGVKTWVFPGGETIPLGTQRGEIDFATDKAASVTTAQEQAKTDAVVPRGEQERTVKLTNEAPAARKSVVYALSEIDKFTEQAKAVRAHPGLKMATGFGGEKLSGIAGTPAANAAALVNTLKSQAFISALGAMRAASKTGGAVGNVSDAEGGRFENAFVSLMQAQSYPQFIEQLDRLIELNERGKSMIADAYTTEYSGVSTYQPLTGQTIPVQESGQAGAPPQAIEMLRQNPQLIEQFEAKYGYRPEGF